MASQHIPACVIWYNHNKEYGFVKCMVNPPIQAYLHKRELMYIGIEYVKPGQSLHVKLKHIYKDKCPAAYDIVLTSEDKKNYHKGLLDSTHSKSNTNLNRSCVTNERKESVGERKPLKENVNYSSNKCNVAGENESNASSETLAETVAHENNTHYENEPTMKIKGSVAYSCSEKISSKSSFVVSNQGDIKISPLYTRTPEISKLQIEISQKKSRNVLFHCEI